MAGATELDMEAAEQLIHVSKKSCKKAADVGRKEGDKEAAVESCSRKRAAPAGEEEGDIDDVVIGGEARRRPRFRSLAAVYRETTRRPSDDVVVGCGRGGAAEEDGERTTMKRAANDAAAGKGR
ncbi:hypothetical protein E2562_017177 [Oryza meyeriana var. granulata]|uniref:Uncharacterized protein n=1 Tax=Oryza meyeriana var. granulata TaxID=110450 RepID=A0A6G1EKJ9_9ORYZ|nr:hypothetical protein E2562_017177 [Oryza meyeriana var. granulata]